MVLSGLLAFVQTTLLIKTVQLCSKLIFAEGGGEIDYARKNKREEKKENWMRPDQAVLKGTMLCYQKYQAAATEKYYNKSSWKNTTAISALSQM